MAEKLPVLEQLANGFELQKLIDYYKSASPKFRPQNTDVSEVLSAIKDPRFEAITQIGEIEYDNASRVGFFVCPLNKDLTEKTSKKIQYDIGKKLLKANFYDAGIFVFYGANKNFRLSLIVASYLGPKREFTTFRRYTYFVSPQLTNKTFINQLSKCEFSGIDNILEAFSIEAVNKDFYTQIALAFTELTGGWRKIGSKRIEKDGCLKLPGTTNETIYKEFAVRLIGRLIFCWFLKKKASKNNIPLIPENLLSTKAIKPKEGIGGYYHSTLEPLFFEVLNAPVEKRKPDYEKQPWSTIPFLNGGLFTPHDDDSYKLTFNNISEHLNDLIVPDGWLYGLLEIFERYNFTIDENTSVDIELAVEPEMLGRIFENLLAEINPETGETARKSTGSYYTPRPIVEYMVDESLKQYLITKTKLPEDKISPLLSYSDEQTDLDETQKDSIIDALHQIKIVDPACGSGAFPMGILQKILLVLQKLDPDSQKWLDRILSNVKDPLVVKELKRKIDQPNYLHKLGIIRDCIYGVDIQPIAIEISKLRFFLSLIVDENVDDKKANRGVEHLPNLEFKFVCANTLVGLPKTETEKGRITISRLGNVRTHESKGQISMFEAHGKINKLKELRDSYLRSWGEEKTQIEKQFRALQSEMFNLNNSQESQTAKLSQWEPFEDKKCEWFDPEWMFGIKDGFDIVIMNPPYGTDFSKAEKEFLKRKYDHIAERIRNSFLYFLGLAYDITRSDGVVSVIQPNEFLFQIYMTKARRFFVANSQILYAINTGEDVFKAIVPTCVVALQKHRVDSYKIPVADLRQCTLQDLASRLNSKSFARSSSDIILATPNSIFAFDLDTTTLINKLAAKFAPFGDCCDDVANGISTSCDEIYIVTQKLAESESFEKSYLKQCIRGGQFNRFYCPPTTKEYILYITDEFDSKVGKHIHRYLSANKALLVRKCVEKKEGSRQWDVLFRARYEGLFKKPKILIRQTADKIVAAPDTEVGYYCIDSVNVALLKETFVPQLNFLIGLLNSSLLNFYYREISQEGGRVLAQVKPQRIRSLPMPKVSSEQQKPVERLVERILTAKQRDAEADVSALEREINELVYAFYGLTPEEVAIIENSVKA